MVTAHPSDRTMPHAQRLTRTRDGKAENRGPGEQPKCPKTQSQGRHGAHHARQDTHPARKFQCPCYVPTEHTESRSLPYQ